MAKNEQGEIFSPKRSEILIQADTAINGERQHDYGPPAENFNRIAEFWTTYLGKNLNVKLSPRQVAEMMILLKTARLIQSPTDDTYIDIAGYGALAAELADIENPTEVPFTTGAKISLATEYTNPSVSLESVVENIDKALNNSFSSTYGWRTH